ncbi:MAG: hypothetical protein JNM07_13315 [Phycisphaerae bacterium]|nr:hypothetical protein [Phycisphaerae bacterium]
MNADMLDGMGAADARPNRGIARTELEAARALLAAHRREQDEVLDVVAERMLAALAREESRAQGERRPRRGTTLARASMGGTVELRVRAHAPLALSV